MIKLLGNLDLVQAKYSMHVNGFTCWNLTKSDILSEFDEIKVCTAYNVGGVEVSEYPVSFVIFLNRHFCFFEGQL